MFVCGFCNLQSSNERAQICQDCGPSMKWLPEHADQPDALRKYYAAAKGLIFDVDVSDDDFDLQSIGLRQKFKITFLTNAKLVEHLKKKRDAIRKLNKFKIEFDENIVDAYAGGDTLLRFRFENQCDTSWLKAHLYWDDPDTSDDQDFNVHCLNYIKPRQKQIIAGTHVFSRFGPKEIRDMQVVISNLEQENAKFTASSFTFKIGNAGQTIINNITKNTTQNISIEGRGVVDASGADSDRSQTADSQANSLPIWKTLTLSYQPETEDDFIETVIERLISAQAGSVDPIEAKKASLTTTLRDEIESLFQSLKGFNSKLSSGDANRIVATSDISLPLLEVFHFKTLEAELDNLIGIAFENPQKVTVDSDNYVNNFVGEATLITTTGLTIFSNHDNEVTWTISYAWNQLKPNGLCFYRQRFGPGSFLISFGDESFKQNVPGLKFDLRRYQGAESVDSLYGGIEETFSNILLLAPEVEEIAPRRNDDSVGISPVEELEYDTKQDGSIKEAVASFAQHLDFLEIYQGGDYADETQSFVALLITDPLKEVIASVIPGCSSDDIVSILLENPADNYVDPDTSALGNFVGVASVISTLGITAIQCNDNNLSLAFHLSWVEIENAGVKVMYNDDADEEYSIQQIILGYVRHGTNHHLYFGIWDVSHSELSDYCVAVGNARQALSRVYDLTSGRGENASFESQGQVLTDGSIYDGQFDGNGKCTGYASYAWFNGTRYTGEFANGFYNGQGEFYFLDGRHYAGNWINGLANGYGVLTYANGDVYEGEFVNDLTHGEGTYTFLDGAIYTGSFEDGNFSGIGTFTWSNGTEYTGEWSFGLKHGRGLMSFPDGTTQEGVWDNGEYQEENTKKTGLVSSFVQGFKESYKTTSGK